MDAETAMQTVTEGSKALTKLGEIAEKVFGPYWTRKQADANAYADERKLQTIRENPDMDIMYLGGQMNARARTPEAFAARAEQRMLNEAIKQEENLENVLEIAGTEVRNAETVSDESLDEDWLTRFFNIVRDVSSSEMQYIWGKILAGEIATPNSFSMKTLDIIRNMSKRDAEAFQRILPLVIKSSNLLFVTSNEDLLTNYGSSYDDVLLLSECGLMNAGGLLGFEISVSDNNQDGILNNESIIIIRGYNSQPATVRIGVHSLTKAGQELFGILSYIPNRDYIIDFAKMLYDENGNNINLAVYPVTGINDKSISYSQNILAEFNKNKTQ